MSILQSGACVGVYFKASPGVHNGKFIGPVTNYNPATGIIRVSRKNYDTVHDKNKYKGVLIRHWTIRSHKSNTLTNNVMQEVLYIPNSQLQRIDRTPYFSNPYCTPKATPGLVSAGDCIGIWYYDPSNKTWDIKNGKLLYWVGKGNIVYCQLNPAKKHTFNEVDYSHWPPKTGIPVSLIKASPTKRGPKVGQHDQILGVFKTTVPINHQVVTGREVTGKTKPFTIIYV